VGGLELGGGLLELAVVQQGDPVLDVALGGLHL
jgi:hypothetical protein